MMNRLVLSADFTWATSQVFIWSCIEPFVGILCACLPTYAPLVRRWYSTTKSRVGRSAQSGEAYPRSSERQVKGYWTRIQGGLDAEMGDGEVELKEGMHVCEPSKGNKNYSSHGQSVRTPEGFEQTGQGITVTQNFSWPRTH